MARGYRPVAVTSISRVSHDYPHDGATSGAAHDKVGDLALRLRPDLFARATVVCFRVVRVAVLVHAVELVRERCREEVFLRDEEGEPRGGGGVVVGTGGERAA